MKRVVFSLVILFAFEFLCASHSIAQTAFSKEIQAFKHSDSLQFPAAGQILFIGSSSFTNWKDVQEYFPGKRILNRAFGGSALTDLITCRYDVIFPYQPKQIVIYCGENDFAASDTVTVDMVTDRFKTLYALIRSKYKTVPVAYISMKPSPSRELLLQKFKEANKQIHQFIKSKPNAVFINVYPAMLNIDGSVRAELFLEDQLHMNTKGYMLWKKIIQPYLLK